METASQPAPAPGPSEASAPALVPLYTLQLAAEALQWDQVREIRYRALRHSGDIPAAAGERFGEPWDFGPGAMTFVLARGGKAIATTRTIASSARRPAAMPALGAYREQVAAAIAPGATIVEASATVVDPGVRGDSKAALFHLFKAHMLRCVVEDADWLLMAVNVGEIGFYRRMFNMDLLSGPERYPGLEVARVLMGVDFRQNAALIAKRIPTLAVAAADAAEFAASGRVPFGSR